MYDYFAAQRVLHARGSHAEASNYIFLITLNFLLPKQSISA